MIFYLLTTDCANRILEKVDEGSLKSVMATEYKDRSVLDHERYSRWRNAVYRWSLLKRAGVEVSWGVNIL